MNKYYITNAIPYVNARPHIGHALEFIQSDTIARFKKTQGFEVKLLCGGDENALKNVQAAEEAKQPIQEFVDKNNKLFEELAKSLNTEFDIWQKASTNSHFKSSQKLWEQCEKNGDIYKKSYEGLYCVGCESFYTKSQLNEKGECFEHPGKKLEEVKEENYFFKLSKYTNRLLEAISKEDMKILPSFRKEETLNMLKEIGDVSFSRPSKDIAWGVPVPSDATQTMYVWCDALANYITALGYGESFGSPTSTGNRTSKFERFWPADIHVVGKDIMKFHTIFWPAMLMSAGLSLPKIIFVHGWVNVKGEKMSKSLGNVIDPIPLIEKYGSEAVRFYLAHETSVFGDSDYSDKHFSEIYSGLLVNGLGNLLARTLKMISLYPAISKPEEGALARYPIKKNLEFLTTGEKKRWSFEQASPSFLVDNVLWLAYQKAMAAYEISQAIKNIWIYLGRLDEYIEDYKLYKMVKSQPEEAKVVLWHLAYSLASVAWMIKPFMPETADKILLSLGVEPTSREEWKEFSAKEFAHLFPRIQ